MWKFFKQFIIHPRSVGAISPSGKSLSEKMMEPIDFDSAKVIAEFGPGTGSFTREIIARKKADTVLISIEKNKEFYKILCDEFGDKNIPNFHLINGSAENADELLAGYGINKVDYIVSGLPFTSLPKTQSERIFNITKKIIGDGRFITFQYSKIKRKLFEKHFDFDYIIRENRNLPPALVFVLKNKPTTEL